MIAGLQTAISNAPRRRAVEHRLTAADRVKIRADRLALLMRGAPVGIGVSVVNAAIVAAVAWTSVDNLLLVLWAGLVVAVGLVLFALWFRYSRPSAAQSHGLAAFANFYMGGMALNGVLWGALAPIFAVHGLLGNAFLPFMIAAMAAASIASAGAFMRAVLLFNVPALVPFAAVYALSQPPYGPAIAVIVCLFAAATIYLAWTTNQMVIRSIRLRSRNDRLLDALKKQVDAAHESEKRFRALVESSQDVTLIFSPEGRVTYASPSVAQALGGPPQALLGKTTKDIVHPDDLPLFRAVGEKTLSKLGEVIPLAHVCLKTQDGDFAPFAGRLTNMLYVPGVEGFVFNGGRLDPKDESRLHAAE
ncbi:MAG: hypothetical protein Kow00133_01970 [Amphiplicatus sp.]